MNLIISYRTEAGRARTLSFHAKGHAWVLGILSGETSPARASYEIGRSRRDVAVIEHIALIDNFGREIEIN